MQAKKRKSTASDREKKTSRPVGQPVFLHGQRSGSQLPGSALSPLRRMEK